MSYALNAARTQLKRDGTLPDLSHSMVLNYFIENNNRVQNIKLVKDFQFFLSKNDEQVQNRNKFKEFVDDISEIRIEPSGEKYLVLKENFRVPKRLPKTSTTKMPVSRIGLENSFSPPDLITPTSPMDAFPDKQGSPVLTGVRMKYPPPRPPDHHPNLAPSVSVPPPVQRENTKYPSPLLRPHSEINSRNNTPTFSRRHDLDRFMPAGLRLNSDTTSYNSSEPDRSSMDLSRGLEHAWVTACVSGNNEQIHRMLLEDPNFCHYQDYIFGYTGIHWGGKQGHIEIIASLLMAGGDVNARSFGGYTALHLAAQQNLEQVIDFLVNQCAADVDVRDNYGKPPADYLPDYASKRSKYWLRKQSYPSVYSPLHFNPQAKQEKRFFGSQGELNVLERTTSKLRASFRRKGKSIHLQRSNTVSTVSST